MEKSGWPSCGQRKSLLVCCQAQAWWWRPNRQPHCINPCRKWCSWCWESKEAQIHRKIPMVLKRLAQKVYANNTVNPTSRVFFFLLNCFFDRIAAKLDMKAIHPKNLLNKFEKPNSKKNL